MADLAFLPKLLLQHDNSPLSVLEDVHGAFLQAAQRRAVAASVSPSGDGLAVALEQRLVLLRGLASRGAFGSAADVQFVSAVDAPEAVTAICWLAAGGQSTDQCLLLGTSAGYLQLHCAASGALLLRQQLHHSAAVAVAVRWSGCGSDPEDLSEDVTVAFVDAAVRLPAWEVWAAVRWHAGHAAARGSGWWASGGSSAAAAAQPHQLSVSKFVLPKGAGPRTAAVCLGPPPPTLYAALTWRPGAAPRPRVRIFTAGAAPPLAAYEAEESAAPGLLSLVSDLASSTAASLLGRARAYVPSRPTGLLGGLRRGSSSGSVGSAGSDADGAPGAGQQRKKRADRIPGEPASLAAAVWDEKRGVTQTALSPCGRWAACCDSLGRVLLVDAGSILVLRMLKGYRDAQVAWLVCSGVSDSAGAVGGGRTRAARPLRAHAGGSSSSLGSLSSSSAWGSLRGSAADLTAGDAQQQQEQQAQQAQQQDEQQQQQADERPEADVDAGGSGLEAQQPPAGVRLPAAQLPQHLLVSYAPRRAVVELWEPQSLTCLGSVQCSTRTGLLLQQPARRPRAGAAHAPNKCLLLDAATLTLEDLTGPLNSLLM